MLFSADVSLAGAINRPKIRVKTSILDKSFPGSDRRAFNRTASTRRKIKRSTSVYARHHSLGSLVELLPISRPPSEANARPPHDT